MTGNDVAAVITAIGFFVTSCASAASLLVSLNNGRKANRIEADVRTIEKATNSMKDALVAATAKASLAEGTAAGLEQGRREDRPPATEEVQKVEIVKIPPLSGSKE